MIRINQKQAQWLVIVLHHLSTNGGTRTLKELHRSEMRRTETEDLDSTGRVALELDNDLGDLGEEAVPEPASMLEDVLAQLNGKTVNEAALIDHVVDALQKPYTRNVLAGRTLEALRKALLTGDELAGLEERLQEQQRSCASCGHEFQHGELSSGLSDMNHRRGGFIFVCSRCRVPAFRACSHADCDAVVSIDTWPPGEAFCSKHQTNVVEGSLPGADTSGLQYVAIPTTAPPDLGGWATRAAELFGGAPPVAMRPDRNRGLGRLRNIGAQVAPPVPQVTLSADLLEDFLDDDA